MKNPIPDYIIKLSSADLFRIIKISYCKCEVGKFIFLFCMFNKRQTYISTQYLVVCFFSYTISIFTNSTANFENSIILSGNSGNKHFTSSFSSYACGIRITPDLIIALIIFYIFQLPISLKLRCNQEDLLSNQDSNPGINEQ